MPRQNFKIIQSYVVESTAKPFAQLMEDLERNLRERLEVTDAFVNESEFDAYLDYEPKRIRVNVDKEAGSQNEGFIIAVTVEQPDSAETDTVSNVFNEVDSLMEELFRVTERQFE